MQGTEDDRQKTEVRLDNPSGDYEIAGFAEEYVAYIDYIVGPAAPAGLFGWALKGIGGLVFIVGVFTIMLGPSSVMVSTFSEPTFFQLIQLYPGPVATVGSLIIAAGVWVEREGKDELLSPEEYLRRYYCFVGPDDCDPAMEVSIEYINGEHFHIQPQ